MVRMAADPVLRKLASNAGGSGTRAWLGGLPGVQLDSQSRRAVVVVPTTGEEARLYLTSLRAVGAHNAVNAGTAALLAMSLDVGITGKTIQDAICQLQPPPHRMEIVFQDDKNVTWINDSKATNVDAAVVGINGIVGRKAVVLLGGLGKPVSTSEDGVVRYGFGRLASALAPHRAVVAFGAQGKSVQEELCAAGVTLPIEREETMVAAVERAGRLVEPGDVVLLSPACASFDEFNDFTHRGRVFAELANGSSKN
ncbi:hypothetical protein CBR_g675 [Chara braunii]|uniref:Mur ligase C-terminal domain-containing protein n=1 Tax=Chara braunii TaxID=69332 RepID=A0A388KBV4_CHABU|nr:hypothetical protein CBR_g675 [Chara braunii]|eukprot:GBG67544.1 hypothetical protein CBR_g675 [Chara braunii]